MSSKQTTSHTRDEPADAPIVVERIGRSFTRRRALTDVDLAVRPAEIVALVGPNGSGKTTLLKILAGLIRADEGRARLFGYDPWLDRAAVMARARFAFAPPPLFESLTPMEHLRFVGGLGARDGREPRASEIEQALRVVGLFDRRDDRVRAFSFGMRQRLTLAMAMVPEPELIVLDEPTDGLDPLAVLELRDVLKRLRRERGVAILLSSHLLVEVDELVDRMLVLRDGRAVFHGSPADLYRDAAHLRVEVDDPAVASAALRAAGFEVAADGERPGRLRLPAGAIPLVDLSVLLQRAGAKLTSYHTSRPTLEQALLAKLRDAPDEVAGPR